MLKHFVSVNDKINYDSLDELIVTEIKNGEGTNKYNDSELRSRIISLENNKLSGVDAESVYAKKDEVYNKQETDALISGYSELVDQKLGIEDAKDSYIEKKSGAITEDLLSLDLINKVNARYENKRPESGTGGDISESDFNLLKVQVGNNTTSIAELQQYINYNVMTTDDKIGLDMLDSAVAEAITKARLNNVPIELNDLAQDVQDKLNNTITGSFDTLESNVQKNTDAISEFNSHLALRHGEVLMGAMKSSDSDKAINIQHTFILPDNVIIAPSPDKLTEVMDYAEAEEIEHVIDIENNILYGFSGGSWATSDEYAAASEFLAGKFALEYGTKNLYFGFSPEEIDVVIDVGSLVKRTELAGYLSINAAADTYSSKTELEAANQNITTLSTQSAEHETKIIELETTISSMTEKIITLENTITALTGELESMKEQITNIGGSETA